MDKTALPFVSAPMSSKSGAILQLTDGTIQACSPSVQKILGLTLDQLQTWNFINPSPWRLIHEDGSPFSQESLPTTITLQTRQPCSNTIVGFYKPTGELIWLHIDTQPLLATDGSTLYGAIATLTDITQQRSKAPWIGYPDLYRTLARYIPNMAVTLFDRELHYLLCEGPELIKMGLVAETLIGKTLWEIFPSDTCQVLEPLYQAALRGEAIVQEVPYQGYIYETYSVPIPNEQGGILVGMVLMKNVTARKQVEIALQESEERNQLAMEVARMFTFEWDPATDWVRRSPQCSPILELTDEAIEHDTGEGFFQRVHPDDRERFLASLQSLTPENQIYRTTYRVVCPTGKIVTLEESGRAFFNPQRQLTRLIGMTVDITERKQTEEILYQTNERLNVALKSSPITVFTQDRGLRYTWIYNPKHYSSEAIIERTDIHLISPEEAVILTELKQNVLETGCGIRKEVKLTFEGQEFYYDVTLDPLLDGQGVIGGITGAAIDITDRKQMEATLRASEKRFRTLADNIAQLVWMADAQGSLFWCNHRWFEYTGTSLPQIEGRGWEQVHHPEHLDRVMQKFYQCVEKGQVWEDTFPLRSRTGEFRWFLSRAVPISDEQGQIICWFGTHTDITERQEAEEERNRFLKQEQIAREQAEQANQIKDELLAILSHELRTPLNPILGWAKLLQSSRITADKFQQGLAAIERNAKQQVQLIDDLLDISHIVRGKLTLQLAPVTLTSPILAALETVRFAAESKSIQLEVLLDPDVGPTIGDAGRLQQMVWNLLSNAIKFTPSQGLVTVQLTQVDRWAQIQVSDTGKGIQPEFLPYVFELFRQQDSSPTRRFGGLGLGLAIARHVVEAHGGTITAESAGEGEGATFTVQLPLRKTVTPSLSIPTLANPKPQGLKNLQVLIVDDEIDSLEVIATLLEEEGALVTTASSGMEALQRLTQSPFTLLISDIGMSEMDGYSLLRQVRVLPPQHNPKIPAIALTAYVGDANQRQALAAGFQSHLAKPIEPEQLLIEIDRLLAQNRAE